MLLKFRRYFIFLLLIALAGCAPHFVQIASLMRQIAQKQKEMGHRPDTSIRLRKAKRVSSFTLGLGGPNYGRTSFDEGISNIRRHSLLSQGGKDSSFVMAIDNEGQPFSQGRGTFKGADYKLYWRGEDTFIYGHELDEGNHSGLKEWVYMAKPNRAWGSEYFWKFQSDQAGGAVSGQPPQTISLAQNSDGSVSVGTSLAGDPGARLPIAQILPLVYWTKDGQKKACALSVVPPDQLKIALREPAAAYPLLMDPTLLYGQWLSGGFGSFTVQALAVSASTMYAGGYSSGPTTGLSVVFSGTYSAGSDGFVIAVTDAGTPTVNWGQWLGGTANDQVTALDVSASTLYAGGWSVDSASWETVSFQGAHSGGSEGFVVAMTTGGTPSLSWGQWLGGTASDRVLALAVSASTVYAGGDSVSSASFETVSFQGAKVGTEGFVVAITAGGTPSLSWGQWLGGTNVDAVNALAVTGSTLYAGGFSVKSANWEAVSFQGTQIGTTSEGFVVAITAGGTPSLSWGQWLGGTDADVVNALAVSGTTVYAGGYSVTTVSWEVPTVQAGTHSGGSEGFVVAITAGGTPTLNWGQWLGGTNADVVNALAVTGSTLYAGGYSLSSASWESVTTFSGAHSGGSEGFVVEITAGGTPTLTWAQWLGGTSDDRVLAVNANGATVYAGGDSLSSASWESVTTNGVFLGGTSGFVVAITMAATPTLNWGQWLGGTDHDVVYALAMSGGTIYAGGASRNTASWESVTFQGTFLDTGLLHTEGFVVAIATGGTPSLSWGQWLGGNQDQAVEALAVSGSTLYAGGYSSASTSWESVTFQGTSKGLNIGEGWVMAITTGGTPSLTWGQWLGGESDDEVKALAVSGTTVYAGGYSLRSLSWESVTFQGSHNNNDEEGWVVAITAGGTPSLSWGQWLGSDNKTDEVQALAVSGTTVYAGGFSIFSNIWEVPISGFQGVHSGNSEGFVVAITAGGTPSLSWGQWLGGTGFDFVRALAVSGTTVYAGGDSSDSTSWESPTSGFQGAYSGGTEGYVVAITAGGTPSLSWGQWLGGTDRDFVSALAVNDATVYAGGYSVSTVSWETVSFQGAHSGGSEGFVVAITAGGTPTLNWGQWLGGTDDDAVNALVTSGATVYAGGYSANSASWESVTFQGVHSGKGLGGGNFGEGFVVRINVPFLGVLDWEQWINGGAGTGGNNVVRALAVSASTVYATGEANTGNFVGVTFQGAYSGGPTEAFVVAITDGGTPSLNWGQWLGGTNTDVAYALAVSGATVYAGGYSMSTVSWETVSFQGVMAGTEGFVVAIAGGGTPSLLWGQWLGGTDNDAVFALAVSASTLYAGGYSVKSDSWDTVSFQGAHSGGTSYGEGWVVAMTTGGTPSLGWGQWLGGTDVDNVQALSVSGATVYAGGISHSSTSWESVTVRGGAHSGGYEGYVVAITAGGTPSLIWGQWLGGTQDDQVLALAVSATTLYAGGHSLETASFESVSFQGSFIGTFQEGMVVAITTGGTPTLNWGQWLGGTGADQVWAVAVSGSTVYAGGYSNVTISWEVPTSAFQGTHSGAGAGNLGEGFVVGITTGGTPTLSWGQWLGGTDDEQVEAVAVKGGNTVYAGGYSINSASWESPTSGFLGTDVGTAGFVVAITDTVAGAATPVDTIFFGMDF